MLKKILKYVAGVCLTATILLAVQGISAEAAEYTKQEIDVMELPEGYSFENMQILDDGIVMVRYEKEDDPTNEIMPLSQTVTKTAILRFYTSSKVLLMEFLETSSWAYGGATGTTPYLGATSYSARYVASGVTAWTQPKIISSSTSSGYAKHTVQIQITWNGEVHTLVQDAEFTFN